MLDRDASDIRMGINLPLGWHFPLLAGETRRSVLRADGFPGLGVEMPDLGLPRLVLGGRLVLYLGNIPVGSTVSRTSEVKKLYHKQSTSGPMAVATLVHELRIEGSDHPAIVETQTYLLFPTGQRVPSPEAGTPAVSAEVRKTVTPDETMLFQYSALGFNSHKIHIDRDYARKVEGYPDLVVNGGLTTLLLTEFLRDEIGIRPAGIRTRHSAPLYCGRPIEFVAGRYEGSWRVCAHDEQGRIAVELEVLAE
jgi:3-methylfumaryl-CoA hydratase